MLSSPHFEAAGIVARDLFSGQDWAKDCVGTRPVGTTQIKLRPRVQVAPAWSA
jgi:hypothetical protein